LGAVNIICRTRLNGRSGTVSQHALKGVSVNEGMKKKGRKVPTGLMMCHCVRILSSESGAKK